MDDVLLYNASSLSIFCFLDPLTVNERFELVSMLNYWSLACGTTLESSGDSEEDSDESVSCSISFDPCSLTFENQAQKVRLNCTNDSGDFIEFVAEHVSRGEEDYTTDTPHPSSGEGDTEETEDEEREKRETSEIQRVGVDYDSSDLYSIDD